MKIYNSRICIYPPCLPVVFCVEITAFSDRHAKFEKLNTEILGVSIDSVVGDFPMLFQNCEKSALWLQVLIFFNYMGYLFL